MLATFLLSLALASQQPEVTVQASAAVPAITRILDADNLDVESLPPREVAERMRLIPRGAAPKPFWDAYQEHVRAWSDYAAAREKSRSADLLSADPSPAVGEARVRINHSFDRVEKVARAYGVFVPIPRTRL